MRKHYPIKYPNAQDWAKVHRQMRRGRLRRYRARLRIAIWKWRLRNG
jgi:hypothetical protein